MQDLGRKEVVSLLLTSCVTVAKVSEMPEVVGSPHCSGGSTSGVHSTGTNLLCAALMRKEEANSSRMQLLEDVWRKGLVIIS